jgi:hypothetical protein
VILHSLASDIASDIASAIASDTFSLLIYDLQLDFSEIVILTFTPRNVGSVTGWASCALSII